MKAVVYTNYGPPDVLNVIEVEKPTPKDNEVLIKLHATTVNRTDCGFLRGKPIIVRFFSGLFKPKETILGSEFAGEIVAVGKSVKLFMVGDAVFGLSCNKFGAHAEFLCMPEEGAIAHKPSNMNYEEAAAICEGPWLALNIIKELNIQKGQKVLVNGASGSIGSSAVQLAKYYGADITAVCGTKNLALAQSLGASKVIDYTQEDFTNTHQQYDHVIDAVGASSFFKCKKLLLKNGTYTSTELGYLVQNPFLAMWTSKFGSKKVMFPIPKENKEIILFFKELAEAGALKAVIDRRYTLDQTVEAYRYVETKQKTGSVVVYFG